MHRLLQGDVGVGQDGGRAARRGRRHGERLPGGVHGAHGDPRRPALPDLSAGSFGGASYPVGLLTAAVDGQRSSGRASQALADGRIQLVVGTQALIQEGIRFRRLGLVVIDEQHRFGVLQRDDLIRKGYDVGRARHDRNPDPAHPRSDGVRRSGREPHRREAPGPEPGHNHHRRSSQSCGGSQAIVAGGGRRATRPTSSTHSWRSPRSWRRSGRRRRCATSGPRPFLGSAWGSFTAG